MRNVRCQTENKAVHLSRFTIASRWVFYKKSIFEKFEKNIDRTEILWWFQNFLPHSDTTSQYRDTRENVTTNLSCQTEMDDAGANGFVSV